MKFISRNFYKKYIKCITLFFLYQNVDKSLDKRFLSTEAAGNYVKKHMQIEI